MNPSYDIIKTFITFSMSKNIDEAAKGLGLTQSTVSHQLKTFENAYESPVFTFQGKKKVLTHFGKDLLNEFKPLFTSIDKANRKIQDQYRDLSQLKIRIGTRLELSRHICSHVTFPGKIEYFNMGTTDVHNALLLDKIDFGFCRRQINSTEIIAKKIINSPINLVVHKSLVDKDNIIKSVFNESFLKNAPFFTYSPEAPYIEEWCKANKFKVQDLNTRITLSNWSAILDLTSKKKGYTLCPSYYSSKDKNLLQLQLPKSLVSPLQIYLLYSKATRKIFFPKECFDFKWFESLS